MDESANERLTINTGIPMSQSMREQIERVAVDRRWTRSAATRYLIERGLEAEAAEKEKVAA